MKGFVDLQVNGYLGIDFSAPGLSLEQVRQVVFTLRDRGTVAFCPTVITSSMEVYSQNLPVLAAAIEEKDLRPHLLGIHVEGPFISPLDGARGAHPRCCVLPPSVEIYKRLQEWARNQISLVTLAPDVPGAMELIGYIVSSGTAVSLGHHLASRDEIAAACQRGAVSATHLGNGIPNLLPRHPNPIWEQLAEDRLAAMIITDGHHVPQSFVQVVVKTKTVRHVIVVSDAAPIAGLPPGLFSTLGQEVVLEESGRIWNPKGNHLVGSSACMLDCLNWLASVTSLSESDLWQVGYYNPLGLIKRKLDDIRLQSLPNILFEGRSFSRPH